MPFENSNAAILFYFHLILTSMLFSFSVEEIKYEQNADGIMEPKILLNVAAYAPGEVESAVADVACRLNLKV